MSREERSLHFMNLENKFQRGDYNHLDYSQAQVISSKNIVFKKNTNVNNELYFFQGNIIELMQYVQNAAVLIFCSSKSPGGGVRRGAKSQEEDLSLASTWYFQVKNLKNFYLERGMSALNTDDIIYVEKGYLLKDIYQNDIGPVEFSFIGATAVNLNGLKDQGINLDKDIHESIMSKRIENILKVAEMYNKNELILGAFGCGVFGYNPSTIAKIFKTKISEGWFTGKITFAILDPQMLNIFKNEFYNR